VIHEPEPGRMQKREYGIAILSKYKILSHQHYPLSSDESEQRGLLAAVLDVDGRNLHFYTTHLGLAQSERVEQVKEIINIVASHTMEPCIITGDFNAYPDSVEVASMSSAFCSAFADVHDAFTFPAMLSRRSITYSSIINLEISKIERLFILHLHRIIIQLQPSCCYSAEPLYDSYRSSTRTTRGCSRDRISLGAAPFPQEYVH